MNNNNISPKTLINNQSIFHLTAKKCHIKNFKYIIEKFSYIQLKNDNDSNNFNIVHKLILWKNLEGLKLLEEYWKENNDYQNLIHKVDNNNMNILELSIKRNDLVTINYLIEKYPKLINHDSLFLALDGNNTQIIKLLIEKKKLKLDFKSQEYRFPNYSILHFAFYKLNLDLIKYLLYRTNIPLCSSNFHKNVCQPFQLLFTKEKKLDFEKIQQQINERYIYNYNRLKGKKISKILLEYINNLKIIKNEHINYIIYSLYDKNYVPNDIQELIIKFYNGSFVINNIVYKNKDFIIKKIESLFKKI